MAFYTATMFMPHPDPVVRAVQNAAVQNARPPQSPMTAAATMPTPTAPAVSNTYENRYNAILAALNKEPLSWGKAGTATGAGAYATPTAWQHTDPNHPSVAGYVPQRNGNPYLYKAAPEGYSWGIGRTVLGDRGTTMPFTREMLARAETNNFVPAGTPISAVEYTPVPGGTGAANWMVMPTIGTGGNYYQGGRIPIYGQGQGDDYMPTIGYEPIPVGMARPFALPSWVST